MIKGVRFVILDPNAYSWWMRSTLQPCLPSSGFLAPYEQGEIGPDLFFAACDMGLEGLVSKQADRPYRAGRSKDWLKVKNRKHPAYRRVQDQF